MLTIVTSRANRHTCTLTHIPTAVERGDVNQNRWCGVVFDDDGDGHVGRSQSAENTVRGQRQNAWFTQNSE